MANGKKFSQMDLLLEIYKHYSFEDTVIIATLYWGTMESE